MTAKPHMRFQRANFMVRNLEASLKFYVEVMGFTLDYVKVSEPTSYSYDAFDIPRGAQLRFAVLSAPDQPRVMALTEVRDPDPPPVQHPRRAAIVLEVPDVDGAMARAKAHGFDIVPEARLVTHDGRIGREIGFIDPDDHLVVIYTIPDL
jgi:catechol 2,3-dioxygenase-like lactoylglutathione lyase family enzyme